MKKYFIYLFLSVQTFILSGQDLNINHYPFYRDGLNPGSFVHAPELNIMLLYNNEFWGFTNEPNTQMVDVSMTLGSKKDNKLGLMVYNDVIGFDKSQNIKLRYARKFTLSEEKNHSFSLGISTGALNRSFLATQMTPEDQNDLLLQNDYRYTVFDVDFGAELMLDKLTVGIASNHLSKPFSELDSVNSTPHYYAYVEYTTSENPQVGFNFRPNLIARYWENTYWVEAGILAFYNDKFWLGGTYTFYSDMTILAGLRLFEKEKSRLYFGYAFKSNLNKNILKSIKPNSHEIFLNFCFGEGPSQWPKSKAPSVRILKQVED